MNTLCDKCGNESFDWCYGCYICQETEWESADTIQRYWRSYKRRVDEYCPWQQTSDEMEQHFNSYHIGMPEPDDY